MSAAPPPLPISAYGGPRPTRTPPQQREVTSPAGTQQVFMDERPRCSGLNKGTACNKVLAEFVTRPWSITCRHCRTTNVRNVPAPLVEPGPFGRID